MNKLDTKTHIMDIARRMTMQQGFDAFSYRDISEEIGIKTSSIHYYFPSKQDLAEALVDDYIDYLSQGLQNINESLPNGYERFKAMLELMIATSGQEKQLCLCGMLSANMHAVSEPARHKLGEFFQRFETWTTETLKQGVQDGSVHHLVRPVSTAAEMVAAIEGAMLIARVCLRPNYLEETLDLLLARIRP